jgi:hypothetical protein
MLFDELQARFLLGFGLESRFLGLSLSVQTSPNGLEGGFAGFAFGRTHVEEAVETVWKVL